MTFVVDTSFAFTVKVIVSQARSTHVDQEGAIYNTLRDIAAQGYPYLSLNL